MISVPHEGKNGKPGPVRNLEEVPLLGTLFHRVTEDQCVGAVMESLEANEGGWVVTANLDHLRRLEKDSSYYDLCQEATLVVADGIPVIWASRLQGTPLPERVCGSDLVYSLSAGAAKHGKSVYFLGGEPDTAEGAANILAQRYPGMTIAGTDCPEFGFEKDPERKQAMIDKLVAAKPDIVYVALGSPKQEILIQELRALLPSAWWVGIGISFSYVCGHFKRPPRLLRAFGVEALYRLCQEPKRLGRRYLIDGVPFALSLLTRAAFRKTRRPPDKKPVK